MTRGELLELLTKEAIKFREQPNFISINKHLTGIDENNMPSKEQIDGVLVAFINSVGMSQCIDYALSYKDFEKKELKKVEQEPTNYKKQLMDEAADLIKDYITQKPADRIESTPHNYITPNQQFFQWIYDKLIYVHNENPDVDYMRSLKERIEDMQKSADKVEPKFRVKYAGSEYNVLEVKDIAGVTYYGIEDEPNHIDYVQAENCERVGGYYHVSLTYKGKVYTKLVHRLVAMAFIPNLCNLPQVNHKDENPSNNCVDNLEWCDQKYNSNYGTNGQRISSNLTNGLRSKVVEQYDRKGNFIKEFPSVAEVSRLLGFPTSSITRCCNGSKKYSIIGGYQWKYKDSNKQILNLPMINKYSQDGTLICSYNSVTEASEDTGVHHSSICQCFTGKKKSAGGFIWKKEL